MRVLVVDDSHPDLYDAVRALNKLGHQVTTAGDADDALHQLATDPTIDVALIDINMPGMDGLELMRAIRGAYREILCAVITGSGDPDRIVAAMRLGAFDYLRKPLVPSELYGAMERAHIRQARRAGPAPLTAPECLTLSIESTRASVGFASRRVDEYCNAIFANDRSLYEDVMRSLNEALMNAVIHGNLELTAAAREDIGWEQFDALLQAREDDPDYSSRRVELTVRLDPGSLSLSVRDAGRGFDPDAVPRNPQTGAGRGLVLIRDAMDSVRWNSTGNEIFMLRRLA